LNDLPTSRMQVLLAELREKEEDIRNQLEDSSDPALVSANTLTLKNTVKNIRKGETEIWRRRAMALAVISFSLLGFPLSLLLKRTQKLVPFFYGMMMVMALFFPLTYGGIQFSRATGAPASITVMSGNYTLFLISMLMLYKVRTRG